MKRSFLSKHHKKTTSGFTLIELLVVVAIIALLSTVVLANVGSARANGRDAKREVESRSMMNAMYIFAAKHNGYVPYDGVSGDNGTLSGVSLSTYGCDSNGTPGSNRAETLQNLENAIVLSGSAPELPLDPRNNGGFCYAYISGPRVGTVNGRDVAESGSFYFIAETRRCGEYNRKIGVSVGKQNIEIYNASGYPGELNNILNTGWQYCDGGSGSAG